MYTKLELAHEEVILVFREMKIAFYIVALGYLVDYFLNHTFWVSTKYVYYPFNNLVSSMYSFFMVTIMIIDALKYEKIRKKYRKNLKKRKKNKNINTCKN